MTDRRMTPGVQRPHARTTSVWGMVVLAVTLAALLLAACDRGGSSASSTSTQLEGMQGIVRADPLDVSAITLPEVDAAGAEQPFTMKAQPGGLLFVYFGYTNCPDLCPTTMADLKKALAQLGPDASRVSAAFVTVDPTRDTPERLVPFLNSFVPGTHALRTTDMALLGQAEDAFLASSTITTTPDGGYEVGHTATAYLVDTNGHVLDEIPFGMTPEALANDLALLLAKQASSPQAS